MNRLIAIAALGLPALAHADRHEATISLRPVATFARLSETGAEPASSIGGGLAGGVSWGMRNWLDVGAELGAATLAEARYPDATVDVSSNPTTGELRRTTRTAQAERRDPAPRGRLGADDPCRHRAGMRSRSAATLRVAAGGGTDLVPDDSAGGLSLDLVAHLRVGLEHRISSRWSVGLAAAATQCFGLDAPGLQMFEASLSLAYTWYPLW
ncbi:MAG: hypothetical protein WKG01_32630 [Kofleriaceae bacterium]